MYDAKFPWKEDKPYLPTNVTICQHRTKTLLTKLRGTQNLLQLYNNIIQDQERCGFIEWVTDTSLVAGHYLSLHRVKKDSPTSKPETKSTLVERELMSDCLAYLRQHLELQGLSERVAKLITVSWRRNTNDAYNPTQHCWCTKWNINPISTSVVNIIQLLVDQFDTGLQNIAQLISTLRSATSTTHLTFKEHQ